jgi:hypothetical protein
MKSAGRRTGEGKGRAELDFLQTGASFFYRGEISIH